MTEVEKDDMILQAALEFGPDYYYEIKHGTLGLTLYIHINDKKVSSEVRMRIPLIYENLRTIVTHSNGEFS